MRTRFVVAAAAIGLMLTTGAAAQAQTPNLSGQWVFDAAKSTGEPVVPRIFSPTGAKPSSPNLTIKQSATELSIVIGDVRLLYKLDGTEQNISADGRAGFPVGKAAWDAGKLVVTLTQEVFNAAKGDYVKVPGQEVYQLTQGVLTIERTQTLVNGTTNSRKLVYTKGAAGSKDEHHF